MQLKAERERAGCAVCFTTIHLIQARARFGVKLHACSVDVSRSKTSEHGVLYLSWFFLPAAEGFVGIPGNLQMAGFELGSLSGVKRLSLQFAVDNEKKVDT